MSCARNNMEEIEGLTLYTGSNGKKGCSCSCIGCSQEKYGQTHPLYQGNLEQIKDILKIAPNIKKAIILGNPDISVDPDFVNETAKLLTSLKISVRFSTSGYNALLVANKVLSGVDKNYIDYYNFSIDSINAEKSQMLRGNAINLSDVRAAIKYCQNIDVPVKIQPTLWECNKNDYKEIIDFFSDLGVRWFSFHCGSFETFVDKKTQLQHITPWEWRIIFNNIIELCKEKNLKLHIPYLFLNNEEMAKYVANNTEHCQPHKLKNTQIWLENQYLRTTHCPLLNEVQKFEYNLYTGNKTDMDFSPCQEGYCPAAAKCLGNDLVGLSADGQGHKFFSPQKEELNTICRFSNFYLA